MLASRHHRTYSWSIPQIKDYITNQERYHVIIIGAGIGGLSAAALLAKRGYKVLLLESHHQAGGNCTSWTRTIKANGDKKTFVFDAGVQDISGLGTRGPLKNLLNQLNATDEIEWRRVRHAYWREGLFLDGDASPNKFIGNICQLFPAESDALIKFFAEMESIYREMYADVDKTGGIPIAPIIGDEILSWPERHPHASHWMKTLFNKMLDAYFKDDNLKKLLSTLSEYITDTPQNLLVEDMAPLFGYYFDGGYYPIGGAQCLANLLAKKIIENGGDIRLNTKAEKILLEDGRVTGVLSSEGTSYFAPLVISNGDVVSTLLELVGKEHLPSHYAQKIINLNRGPSAILLSLGLTKTLPLPARVFIHQNHLEFGIGNPSVIDSSLAPLGHSAVTILCLLSESASKDWHNCGEAYTQQKEAFAEKLLCAVEDSVIPDIRQHIVYKEMATPKTFLSFTKAKNGNIYGAARNAWRPELKSPISGLILVGAGTKTGAGIEAVVVSGTHAADLISQGQLNK